MQLAARGPQASPAIPDRLVPLALPDPREQLAILDRSVLLATQVPLDLLVPPVLLDLRV